MSLTNLSPDVYQQLDSKLDAAVELKQIKSWLLSQGVSATVAEIRDYDAGRNQAIAEDVATPENVAQLRPRTAAYVSESGLSQKEVISRLTQRMLELTDRAWDDFDATSSLKIAEFLTTHLPRTAKLVQDTATEETELPDVSDMFDYDAPKDYGTVYDATTGESP